MADFMFATVGFLIAFPAIAFLMLFTVFTRLFKDPVKGFSRAADVTTFLLLPAVSAVLSTATDFDTGFYLGVAVILFALYMTYRERRVSRDVEIGPLIRKIWRMLFIILSTVYVMAAIIGVALKILDYTKG